MTEVSRHALNIQLLQDLSTSPWPTLNGQCGPQLKILPIPGLLETE